MKRIAIIVSGVGLLSIGVWALLQARQFAWDYDFAKDPACTAALPTDCVKEFRLIDADANVVVAVVPASATSVSADVGKPYGPRRFYAIAVTDNGTESEPSNVVDFIARPGAPINLRF